MESEHPQRPAPAVSRTLGIIGAVVIAEPLSATILFPFVYFMIRDFRTVEEQDVGFWAGLISMYDPRDTDTNILAGHAWLIAFSKHPPFSFRR